MNRITPQNVHETLAKYMLADGDPMVFDLYKSHGARIYDSRNDRELLDFFSFFASSPVGFNHPKLTTPEMIEKLGRVAVNNITNSDLYTVEMAEFVETFFRVAVPKYMKYSFYVAGGAVAVENALKAAMDWKVRKNFEKGYRREVGHKVIHFAESFHGRVGYTLSMTNTADANKTKYFAKFDWPRIINPKLTFPLTEGNLEKVEKLEQLAEKQIRTAFAEHGDDICAIVIEPIQAEGGGHHFRKEFLQRLRTLADEYDVILVFDEVQTGIGLTGKMWAQYHFDVKPDMVCFGKKTQVCGFLCSARIDEVPDNVFHTSSRINSTWGGNLIDMFRFKCYLDIIEEEKLVENAAKVGDFLLNQINDLQAEYPHVVSNARGRGLMCALDLPTPEIRNKLLQDLYKSGVMMLPSGHTSVRFRPPLNITEAEISEGVEIIRRCLIPMAASVEQRSAV